MNGRLKVDIFPKLFPALSLYKPHHFYHNNKVFRLGKTLINDSKTSLWCIRIIIFRYCIVLFLVVSLHHIKYQLYFLAS